MVHLEVKYEYLASIRQSAEINALTDAILLDKVASVGDFRNDASQVALDLIACVRQNDKNKAEFLYNHFSRRNPTKESHWIHDEFVVFALVCAVQKFSFNDAWVKEVLLLTSQTTDVILQRINETFKNILAGNYNAKGDLHQISLVYQHISKNEDYDNERINKMFCKLWEMKFPFYDSTFLNIVSLKAIELAFELKGLLDPQEYNQSKQFLSRFLDHTLALGSILAWISLILVTGVLYLVLWEASIINEKLTSFLISVSGITIMGVIGLHKWLKTLFSSSIRKLFGYKPNKHL